MIVSNIQSINPGGSYQIQVRLQTTAPDHSANIAPTIDVLINHNQSIVNSLVE
jgi:hypothetical protein